MDEKANVANQATETAADQGNIMQHIQDMIGDLLKNAVDKMHKTDTHKHLGGTHAHPGDQGDVSSQMGIPEVKNFVAVMQKFIDNVNVMVAQLESGSSEPGDTDDKFLEGYMATADNVLELAAFSMKDSTTGLSNRYGFDNRLILEWNRATRDKTALSLVIFDVDSFDECKDGAKRDAILKEISKTLENSIKRTTDFIARWSDDEFAVLLPITNESGAKIVAERILMEIGNMDISGIIENNEKSIVSIGVCAHTPEPKEQPVDFIGKAHNAFKKAKEESGSAIQFA